VSERDEKEFQAYNGVTPFSACHPRRAAVKDATLALGALEDEKTSPEALLGSTRMPFECRNAERSPS